MAELDKNLVKEIAEQAVKEHLEPALEEFKNKMMTINVNTGADWKEELGENLKKLLAGEYKELKTKAAITTSGVTGVIPEEWIAKVYDTLPEYGALFAAGMQRIPIAQILNVGSLGTDVTVYWQTEGSAPTESGGAISKLSVTRETLICLLKLSNQALKYSNIDLVNYFTGRVVEKIAAKIDDEGFNGTGSGSYKFTGILNASGVNAVVMGSGDTTFDKVSYGDLVDVIHSINSRHVNGSAWFMSNSVLGVIMKIVDSNGRPIFNYNNRSILGYPVHITAALPATSESSQADKAFIVFGNVRDGLLYGAEDYEVKTSSEAGFTANVTYLRVTQDTALYVANPTLFTVLKTHS